MLPGKIGNLMECLLAFEIDKFQHLVFAGKFVAVPVDIILIFTGTNIHGWQMSKIFAELNFRELMIICENCLPRKFLPAKISSLKVLWID